MRWALFLLFAAAAFAQQFDIAGTSPWLDTKIDLKPQDEVTVSATGELTLNKGQKVTPDGAKRGFADMIKNYPVNDASQGALIGRLGSEDAARPFLIGKQNTWKAPRAGRLFLGINKAGNDAPKGSFHVTVAVKAAPEVSKTDYKLPNVTTATVDQYPRRIEDAQGNLGDNTNFMIVGTEQQVLAALKTAGWVEVDRSNQDAVLAGIEAVLNKRAYVTMPMSSLTLFGRGQDHGFAQADPIQVIAERHHFRIWKAPFQVDGSDVFIGAGTHDIGFDRDQRNNGVTHKIDPEIDKERDYIGQSLNETGLVAKLDYVTPSKPSTEAVTATGATFKSDGRILVIYLIPDQTQKTPATPAPNTDSKNTPTSIFDGVVGNR